MSLKETFIKILIWVGLVSKPKALVISPPPYRRAARQDPYRSVPPEKSKKPFCVSCMNFPDKAYPKLHWPCPNGIPAGSAGPFCIDCYGIWIEANNSYCKPYIDKKFEIPSKSEEHHECGIMSSFSWEWFYPELKPGENPYQRFNTKGKRRNAINK